MEFYDDFLMNHVGEHESSDYASEENNVDIEHYSDLMYEDFQDDINSSKRQHLYDTLDEEQHEEENYISIPNAYGGEDIFSESFEFQGMTMPGIMGGDEYYAAVGNIDEILNHSDPLALIDDAQLPKFTFNPNQILDLDDDEKV